MVAEICLFAYLSNQSVEAVVYFLKWRFYIAGVHLPSRPSKFRGGRICNAGRVVGKVNNTPRSWTCVENRFGIILMIFYSSIFGDSLQFLSIMTSPNPISIASLPFLRHNDQWNLWCLHVSWILTKTVKSTSILNEIWLFSYSRSSLKCDLPEPHWWFSLMILAEFWPHFTDYFIITLSSFICSQSLASFRQLFPPFPTFAQWFSVLLSTLITLSKLLTIFPSF